VQAFSDCDEQGLLLSCGVRVSHCGGFSCCGLQALGCKGFSHCGSWALEHMPSSCGALVGGFFTTEPLSLISDSDVSPPGVSIQCVLGHVV